MGTSKEEKQLLFHVSYLGISEMVTLENNGVRDLIISALFKSCNEVFSDQEAAFI